MKNLPSSALLIFLLSFSLTKAQKIADGETVDLNGLAVTFSILNKESVNIGGNNFDRYKF